MATCCRACSHPSPGLTTKIWDSQSTVSALLLLLNPAAENLCLVATAISYVHLIFFSDVPSHDHLEGHLLWDAAKSMHGLDGLIPSQVRLCYPEFADPLSDLQVRNTVNTGRTVVCTIHQPSIEIFEVGCPAGLHSHAKIK